MEGRPGFGGHVLFGISAPHRGHSLVGMETMVSTRYVVRYGRNCVIVSLP